MVDDLEKRVWAELEQIADPEIPVISLVEMKVVRNVRISDSDVTVTLAPTFVGCPALEHMKDEIRTRLASIGCSKVNIDVSYSPPWSTDMLDESAKEKLRKFGIAPPPLLNGEFVAVLSLPVECPFCRSTSTHLDSEFGATLCKQIFVCDNCRQPFERFKPI